MGLLDMDGGHVLRKRAPANSVEMIGGNGAAIFVPEYEEGTCVVGVNVMEYVYIIGGTTSTETQCFTTFESLSPS
jgi:hypothetical protein